MAAPFQYSQSSPLDTLISGANALNNMLTDRARRQEIAAKAKAMYGGQGQAPGVYDFSATPMEQPPQDAGVPAADTAQAAQAAATAAGTQGAVIQAPAAPPEPMLDPQQAAAFRAQLQSNYRTHPHTTDAFLRELGIPTQEVIQGFGPFSPETTQKLLQHGKVAVPNYAQGYDTPDARAEAARAAMTAEYGQEMTTPGVGADYRMPAKVTEQTFTPAALNVGAPKALAMMKLNSAEELAKMKAATRAQSDKLKATPYFSGLQKARAEASSALSRANADFLSGAMSPQQHDAVKLREQQKHNYYSALIEVWGAAQTQGQDAAARLAANEPALVGAPAEAVQSAIQDGLNSGLVGGVRRDPLFDLGASAMTQPGGQPVVRPTPATAGQPAPVQQPGGQPTAVRTPGPAPVQQPGGQPTAVRTPGPATMPLDKEPAEMSRFTEKERQTLRAFHDGGIPWSKLVTTDAYKKRSARVRKASHGR